MHITYSGGEKYTTETVVWIFEYFANFRAVYIRLRENFELPNGHTLTHVTSKVKTDDSTYMKQNFFKS